MPRVVHFEFGAEDPERASRFYSDVFGWKVQKWEGPEDYWLIQTGEEGTRGIDGAFMRGTQFDQRVINTIDVESVDEVVAKVEASGGTVIFPKAAIPGVGYLAYCKDTEGTTFGIMQSDETAQP